MFLKRDFIFYYDDIKQLQSSEENIRREDKQAGFKMCSKKACKYNFLYDEEQNGISKSTNKKTGRLIKNLRIIFLIKWKNDIMDNINLKKEVL